MSKKGVCASCISFSIEKIVKSDDNMKPSWLNEFDYVDEFIKNQNNFKLCKPNDADSKIVLEKKSIANKKILYWAADPKPFNNIITKDAKHAYNNFKNFGIAKCDSNGKVTVHFKFPQIYSTVQKGFKKPQTYHPHLHFVIANHNETGWLSQIYTKILIKKLNYNEVTTRINNKNYLLLNTLPCEYYAQDHIPNSFNLFHKQIKKMSTNELHTWFLNVIKRHYNDLYKLVKSGKMHIYEIPIICYCAHKDCNASELALEELAKKGFVNCSLYEGGMKEYNEKHKI